MLCMIYFICILITLDYFACTAGPSYYDSKITTSGVGDSDNFIFNPGVTADFEAKKDLSVIAFGSCR